MNVFVGGMDAECNEHVTKIIQLDESICSTGKNARTR